MLVNYQQYPGISGLRTFFNRAWVFYVLIFLISTVVVDYKDLKSKSRLRVLNALMPNTFTYLIDAGEKNRIMGFKEATIYRSFYRKFSEYSKNTPEVFNLLGFCQYFRDNDAAAIKSFQKSIALEPNFFWSLYNLAWVYFSEGNDEQAIVWLKLAINLNPDHSLDLIRNSSAIYRTIQFDNKIDDLEIRQRLLLGYQNAFRMIIISYQDLKQYNSMLEYSRLAINSNLGNQGVYWYYAGRAYYEMGQYKQALECLQQSVQIDNDIPESYLFISLIYKSTGEMQRSEAAYTQYSESKAQENKKRPFLRTKKPAGFLVPDLKGDGLFLRVF